MSESAPDWGGGSRFYLPNEDAAVVSAALAELGNAPRRPVFVGGSGMTLLQAAATLPHLEKATFVDIAPFQVEYFQLLLRALGSSASPESLRSWFGGSIYPALRAHFQARGHDYSLNQVLAALEEHFGVGFLFDPRAFARAKEITRRVASVRADIVAYLAGQGESHDFIYLSNVPDYLDAASLGMLFEGCRGHHAPVYLVLTSACQDREAPRLAWEAAGFTPHEATERLNGINRGLGSPSVHKDWNRPGTIHLLLPQRTGRHFA